LRVPASKTGASLPSGADGTEHMHGPRAHHRRVHHCRRVVGLGKSFRGKASYCLPPPSWPHPRATRRGPPRPGCRWHLTPLHCILLEGQVSKRIPRRCEAWHQWGRRWRRGGGQEGGRGAHTESARVRALATWAWRSAASFSVSPRERSRCRTARRSASSSVSYRPCVCGERGGRGEGSRQTAELSPDPSPKRANGDGDGGTHTPNKTDLVGVGWVDDGVSAEAMGSCGQAIGNGRLLKCCLTPKWGSV